MLPLREYILCQCIDFLFGYAVWQLQDLFYTSFAKVYIVLLVLMQLTKENQRNVIKYKENKYKMLPHLTKSKQFYNSATPWSIEIFLFNFSRS